MAFSRCPASRIWPLTALVLAGCAGWQLQQRSELYSRTTALSHAEAWQAARTALLKSGYTVTDDEASSGRLVGMKELPGPQVDDLARGTARYTFTTWWRLQASLIARVAPEPDGRSRITADTTLRAEGSSLHGERTAMVSEVPLMSNGALERAYLETLDLYLADARGAFGEPAP